MKEITNKEMLFVLAIVKSPEIEFNANSISKVIGVSSMGALKIAKRLEKEGILNSKKLGKAVFYNINKDNDYAVQYVKLIFKREAEQSHAYIKVWICEIKKIKNVSGAILFGSVLKKHKDANDIDVVLITDKSKFNKLKQEVEEINVISIKRLHPVYQTKEDFINNIKKRDRVMLNAVKGIVVFGEDLIIDALSK